MNTPATVVITPRPPTSRVARGTRQAQQLKLEQSSGEARRKAAAVLEVLAGLRTPLQAAEALGLALPGYYHLELRALQGLIRGCEPPAKGRQKEVSHELAESQKQCQRLTVELHRYQALARAAQRTVGLAPPPPAARKPAPGKRPRKPKVRALQAIELIQAAAPAAGPPAPNAIGGSAVSG